MICGTREPQPRPCQSARTHTTATVRDGHHHDCRALAGVQCPCVSQQEWRPDTRTLASSLVRQRGDDTMKNVRQASAHSQPSSATRPCAPAAHASSTSSVGSTGTAMRLLSGCTTAATRQLVRSFACSLATQLRVCLFATASRHLEVEPLQRTPSLALGEVGQVEVVRSDLDEPAQRAE